MENFVNNETINNDQYTKTNDFGAMNGAEQYNATGNYVDEQLAKAHKREVKSDVISAVASLALSAAPMVFSAIKYRNDAVPYKPTIKDFVKFGLINVIPVVKAVDTAFLGGKIQNAIDSRSPIKFNDIRNISNVLQAYQPFHNIVGNYFENMSRRSRNEQPIANSAYDVASAWLSGVNLIAPFVIYKFTDDTMTFTQKCSSILPIGLVGGYVRKFAYQNPSVAHAYEVATAALGTVSYGNKMISNAVRPTPGSTVNKGTAAFTTGINFVSDLLGVNNHGGFGGNGGYNGGYGNNGYNSRFY